MNAAVSIVLLAAVLGVIVFLLSRRENTRRSQYGPAGLSEFRTDLPLDECFDRLDEHRDADEFVYECRREKDGGFLLHLTLHQPTQQPLDTLYTLRLAAARPGPFRAGSLWLCADLCCCGAGPAAAGNAAPGKKDYLTSWRAESRRHSCARQAASNTS